MIIGAEGDKDRNFDFLASTEILVLDQAEMFLMQVSLFFLSRTSLTYIKWPQKL